MKRFISALCATALTLSVAAPASAGVLQAPVVSAPSNLIKVQGTDYSGAGGTYYPDYHRRYGDRVIRRDDIYYWRGYPGSRYYRPGYRRHGEFWFPAAAFIAGAIIGGAIASQPYRGSSAHVRWCYSRYRSYRDWDNTFQPYRGPRRECVSPYWP